MQLTPFPILTDLSDAYCVEVADLINRQIYQVVSTTDRTSFLAYKNQALTVCLKSANENLEMSIDFVNGRSKHRRQYGGGKSQPMAKACGLYKHPQWSILDATAGLGRDAFVLASLGASVELCEQHPALYGLLVDAAYRATNDPETSCIINRMTFMHVDACLHLNALSSELAPDVVYLDPMYPERKKSAKIKKEMQILQSLVSHSGKARGLLEVALKKARHRVVVKRPKSAKPLIDQKPNYAVSSVNTRYDVYVCSN